MSIIHMESNKAPQSIRVAFLIEACLPAVLVVYFEFPLLIGVAVMSAYSMVAAFGASVGEGFLMFAMGLWTGISGPLAILGYKRLASHTIRGTGTLPLSRLLSAVACVLQAVSIRLWTLGFPKTLYNQWQIYRNSGNTTHIVRSILENGALIMTIFVATHFTFVLFRRRQKEVHKETH